jgi:hypothetical protein
MGDTGSNQPDEQRAIEVKQPGEVYPGDDYVYWGFAAGGLGALGQLAGLPALEVSASVIIDGHPRTLATLRRES